MELISINSDGNKQELPGASPDRCPCSNHIVRGKLNKASFLNTIVQHGTLDRCTLKNALLLDAKEKFRILNCTPHRITKPVIAMGWDFLSPGLYRPLIANVLQNNKFILLHYDYTCKTSFSEQLNKEVAAKLQNDDRHRSLSPSQQLLQSPENGSAIHQIKQKAAAILKYCQGQVLPGGEDVEKILYRQTDKIDNMHRSLLEAALIQYARKKHFPTLGICRGAQMINVVAGGTLRNLTRKERKTQDGLRKLKYTKSPHGKWLHKYTGKQFLGESAHHQAIDKLGKGLHIILKRRGVPKLAVSKDGLFIASQIHPEVYLYAKAAPKKQTKLVYNNKKIYQRFLRMVQNSQATRVH